MDSTYKTTRLFVLSVMIYKKCSPMTESICGSRLRLL
jgi:hypothetical protein